MRYCGICHLGTLDSYVRSPGGERPGSHAAGPLISSDLLADRASRVPLTPLGGDEPTRDCGPRHRATVRGPRPHALRRSGARRTCHVPVTDEAARAGTPANTPGHDWPLPPAQATCLIPSSPPTENQGSPVDDLGAATPRPTQFYRHTRHLTPTSCGHRTPSTLDVGVRLFYPQDSEALTCRDSPLCPDRWMDWG